MAIYKRKILALFICLLFIILPFSYSCDKDKVIVFNTSFMDKVKKSLSAEITLEDNFSIVYIDVGEGDCTFIHFPDGKNMLVDCGSNDANGNNLSAIKDVLSSYNVEKIDYFVLTQPESKNIGNAKYIVNNYTIGKAYIPKIIYLSSFPVFSAVNAILQEKQIETEYSYNFIAIKGENYGGGFLAPQKNGDGYAVVNSTEDPSNAEVDAISPVIYMEYNGVRFLLGGDQRIAQEEEIILDYKSTLTQLFFSKLDIPFSLEDIDFYKASKNGDSSANGTTLLEVLKPKNVIISCGSDNYYGHPSSLCISNILEANENASIYTTNVVGSVFVLIDKNGEQIIKTQSNLG